VLSAVLLVLVLVEVVIPHAAEASVDAVGLSPPPPLLFEAAVDAVTLHVADGVVLLSLPAELLLATVLLVLVHLLLLW